MTKKEKKREKTLLLTRYQQLHQTVIKEHKFLKLLGSDEALIDYRDTILDEINKKRRILGYLKF